ncbi:MAG: FprA family A-type flavoprotein [bacterium]|nr:FprA family A-type flavoprotein [bacterium]
MYCTKKVTDKIVWVGANDRRLHLFENLFPIPNGVSYNAYVILDEKTALMDCVDFSACRQFLENLEHTLAGRKLDYLIVNHMEPDHGATIEEVLRRYPEAVMVGNAKTMGMMKQFFEIDLNGRTLEVKEGSSLDLGTHTLNFVMAPMVHWPEVMMTYESSEKILFSADAFGTFGALNGPIFNDEYDFERDWLDDARRYYTNIVGKYGPQVQAVLKKAATLDIQMICPLHGQVWRNNLAWFIDKYKCWSSYEPEEKGVLVAYASMYGNTENVANLLASALADEGVYHISVYDVSKTDVSYLIGEAFKYSHLVLAAPTYNAGVYPAMEHFLLDMKALNLQKRTVALIENGSWAPMAAKQMAKTLEEMKQMTVLEQTISIKSALKESQKEEVLALAKTLAESVKA